MVQPQVSEAEAKVERRQVRDLIRDLRSLIDSGE